MVWGESFNNLKTSEWLGIIWGHVHLRVTCPGNHTLLSCLHPSAFAINTSMNYTECTQVLTPLNVRTYMQIWLWIDRCCCAIFKPNSSHMPLHIHALHVQGLQEGSVLYQLVDYWVARHLVSMVSGNNSSRSRRGTDVWVNSTFRPQSRGLHQW